MLFYCLYLILYPSHRLVYFNYLKIILLVYMKLYSDTESQDYAQRQPQSHPFNCMCIPSFSATLPSIPCKLTDLTNFRFILMSFIYFLISFPSTVFSVFACFFMESSILSICLYQCKIPTRGVKSEIKIQAEIVDSLSSWESYPVFLVYWKFLLWMKVRICQMLFLQLLIWSCEFSFLAYWCD